MKTIPVLLSAVLLAATGASFAQGSTATPRIDQREQRQEQRIQQGVGSGALTPRETYRLEKEQAHIDKAESRAKADGDVSPAERKRLTNMQNRASRDIRHQKHDRQAIPPKG